VTGFLGRNGAGKTTTLRALLGLVRPSAGTATFSGVPYRDLERPTRSVGAVLDGSGAHPGHRARDHLRILAAGAGLPAPRVEAVLDEVGLADAAGRRVGGFSTGMRQRLSLAGALLGDPEVLVLDEPTNGLDPEGIRWLRQLLRRAAADGRTVLVSSHQLAEVAQTVDDVVIVDRGHVVAAGPLDELTRDLRQGVRARTPMAAALAAALERCGHRPRLEADDVVFVPGASAAQVGRAIAAAGVVVHELHTVDPDLEDVFFALTGPGEPTETHPEPLHQEDTR
jgi:ABC-2 type transport system ATP-binding protein